MRLKPIQNNIITYMLICLISSIGMSNGYGQDYKIVGTNQTKNFDNKTQIPSINEGDSFYGQNATYPGNAPVYQYNSDGTVTDLVSDLMWQQSCDFNGDGVINVNDKLSYEEALAGADTFSLAGYSDWRLPSIKEAYSLILFSGVDPSGYEGTDTDGLIPFMDDDVFDFGYGDTDNGERIIDAQFASTTKYVHYTMNGDDTMFGVNLADGRIKGYPTAAMPGQSEDKQFYVMYVRGNTDYGKNSFIESSDGIISDNATGLQWMKNDSGEGMNWEEALVYAESFEYGGYSDWRLPDSKELQSIVDYTRSPETSNSAAIDPLFNCTEIINEKEETDYAYYWSSTTHESWVANNNGSNAVYLSFGKALGYMHNEWLDVHGAGSQRSDPKMGDPDDYPEGHGPQGDAIRIYNYVRLVRTDNGTTGLLDNNSGIEFKVYPNPASHVINVSLKNMESAHAELSLINMLGQVVRSAMVNGEEHIQINVQELQRGIYFLKASNDNKDFTQKVVLE